jgi:isoquinoline 1-oxidoreductase alpha subunit
MRMLKVNGTVVEVDATDDTPLLWALRGELKLTGTKFGCGLAQCGACTVLVDGEPTRACVTPISAIGARDVTTIEGLSGREAEAVHAAWEACDVVQCGYCQTGQIVAACALLKKSPRATDAQIDQAMEGNICRCGTYSRIREAIRQASDSLTQR